MSIIEPIHHAEVIRHSKVLGRVSIVIDVRTLGFDDVPDLTSTPGWQRIMMTASDRRLNKLHIQHMRKKRT